MKADYFDQKGKKGEAIMLPKEIFDVKPRVKLIAQAIRVNLINSRQGTRSTKGRSDLHYSGRKIYKQKHTGRARHGDRTANIFMHGAVAHGPKPFARNATMPRVMKELSIKSALAAVAKDNKIAVIEKLEFSGEGATAKAAKLVEKLGYSKVTIVRGEKENTGLGLRNLPFVTVRNAIVLSTYDVATATALLFTKDALNELKVRLEGKNAK